MSTNETEALCPRLHVFGIGYEAGRLWAACHQRRYRALPDIGAFHAAQETSLAVSGFQEHAHRIVYEQGFDAGYCDALDAKAPTEEGRPQ